MKVVIMAGGKGTRISSVANDIPKPMIKVADKPILEHQLLCLKKQGFTDIIIVTGHLGNFIHEYFDDGSNMGIKIDYYDEEIPLGTAGALFNLKKYLNEDFLLINGDVLFDVDIHRFIAFHKYKNALATLFTHPNNHPYDSALILTDSNSRVTGWLHKEDDRIIHKNRVNAGLHILSPVLLNKISNNIKMDLDRDILKPLVDSGLLYAYDSPEYVKDMGTPDRFKSVCEDYNTGKVGEKNLSSKQKAVFLDRDGTINQYCGFVTKPEQIKLIDGVAQAISKINNSSYLVIVITNQPVIARGNCTIAELEIINNQLETLLGEQGAYVDAIYYCPHHPDKGFDGERIEYKIDCECRKPKPGLLLQAASDYNIDLSLSYMVGDSINDIKAGNSAGCKSFLLHSTHTCEETDSVKTYNCLLNFVNEELLGGIDNE